MKMHVEFHSSSEDFHLRTSWMRTLRIRIDDCENDSIRDRIDSRIVIQSWMIDHRLVIQNSVDDFDLRTVIQNQIDDFECSCDDFNEYLIRTECVTHTKCAIRMRCDFVLKML